MSVRPRGPHFGAKPGWRRGFLAVASRSPAPPSAPAFGRRPLFGPRPARAVVS